MSINIKNIQTSEVVTVHCVQVINGDIVADKFHPQPGKKFFDAHPQLSRSGRDYVHNINGQEISCAILTLAEGWEVVRGRAAKPSPTEVDEPSSTDTVEEVAEEVVDDITPADIPTPTPAPKPQPTPTSEPTLASSALDAIAEKYGQFGRDIAEALSGVIQPKNGSEDVRGIIVEELVRLTKEEPSKYKTLVAKLQPKAEGEDEEDELFEKIKCMVKNDRIIGRYPWLYGPAGSGKSTIAQKVAESMGLPFYSVSSLLQKYELEGYTDAASRLLETSFYKAWTEGGVFCFDEASTSAPEVQVAINTAMAQLIYNFPKMGMLKAHKDFHFIAADNSTGRGGDKRYNSRFKLDASTLDRYTFVEVGYRQAHDMRMAEGDAELVTFVKALRKAIDAGNTEYLATPRASRAIKALQAAGMTDVEALWFGLFSGWKKDDVRTIVNSLTGRGKYFDIALLMLDTFCKKTK